MALLHVPVHTVWTSLLSDWQHNLSFSFPLSNFISTFTDHFLSKAHVIMGICITSLKSSKYSRNTNAFARCNLIGYHYVKRKYVFILYQFFCDMLYWHSALTFLFLTRNKTHLLFAQAYAKLGDKKNYSGAGINT